MFRISFLFLSVLFLVAATFSVPFSPPAEAYSRDHINKLIIEKKRVKDLKRTLATEIENDSLTDAQKASLAPKCLDCDLSKYDFSSATSVCTTVDDEQVCEDLTELDDFDFTGSNLHEANLKEVNLRNASLLQTNVTAAKFNDANLRGVNLSNSTLTHADFACADMQDVLLGSSAANGAMFRGADMRRSRIIFTDMCATDLTGVNLSESHIEAVNMAVAKLRETNFTNARMYVTMKDATALFTEYWHTPQAQRAFAAIRRTEGGSCYTPPSRQGSGEGTPLIPGKTDVSTAVLAGVNLSGSDLRGVNLRGRNLSGADLSHTDLREADLSNANLSRADLTRSNLEGANLDSANFNHANMPYANLKDADIENATFNDANLSSVDLRGVTSNSETSFSNTNLSYARDSNLINETNPLGTYTNLPSTRWLVGSTHAYITPGVDMIVPITCICTHPNCPKRACFLTNTVSDEMPPPLPAE